MFESISSRFKEVFNSLGKKPLIEEKDLDEILREIRLVLLEADVSLVLVKEIVIKLKETLLGREIYKSVSPKQVVLKALYDTVFEILEDSKESTHLHDNPITYYMLVGLQGAGKTTTTGKIAYYLKKNRDKKVLLVSLDLQRPAAYEQLQSLCSSNQLDFFSYDRPNSIEKILKEVTSYATKNFYDVVLLDTAGRLSIDEELMQELSFIYKTTKPKEVLLVIDSMIGQIALNVAKSFHERIPLSGVFVSKADANSRGGAILSCKYVTGVPIKMMGTGEKINNIEVFSAKRIVDRILDQGDILALVEQFEEIEEEEALKLEARLNKGIFTLSDYKKQLGQMKKMGGFGSLMGMMPGLSGIKEKISAKIDDKMFKKQIAIIDSMTKQERQKPIVLNYSRKKRIAKGSGTSLQDINVLLKQYDQISKTMKKFKGGGFKNLMSSFGKSGGDLNNLNQNDIKKLMNKLK